MNLFMIMPMFLVTTTALWGQTMAQNTNTNGIPDTGSHHVIKRIAKRQIAEAPNTACTSEKEGQVHPVPANSSVIWICRNKEWKPFRLKSAVGYTSVSPGKSCKHIRGIILNEMCNSPSTSHWIEGIDSCSGEKQALQIYCDMTTDGGGWHLVWKHSYLQVSPLTTDMFYNSSFYKPCTNLSDGWCNVPNKTRLQPEEMMIAAYHNGRLVYAYKGTFNRNIDHHWTGGTLLMPVTQIVDRCTRSTAAPVPLQHGTLTGLVFDKQYDADSDTLYGSLVNPSNDERWEECHLPSSISSSPRHVQMTMAIYVR